MTGLDPVQRFAHHQQGIQSASVVQRYGLRLLPELYAHLNPMPFAAAGQMEVDLALGGAVTFISSKDHPGNIINSADLGRQIQMSHYSGPWPFEVGDKKPHKAWAGLGWNPIQTGDCYMNPSKVVEVRNDGQELYLKCIPMQWPLNNVPGDCTFETWTTLEGPIIHMRYRCTNQRSDHTQYRPCPQELPAVYTISKLWRLMSYTGDKPFTQDKITHVTNDWRKPWPWTRFVATERWAALVNDDNWGLGVFKDDGGEFHGGIHGDARSDDPKHGSTAYVAPIHMETASFTLITSTSPHRLNITISSLPWPSNLSPNRGQEKRWPSSRLSCRQRTSNERLPGQTAFSIQPANGNGFSTQPLTLTTEPATTSRLWQSTLAICLSTNSNAPSSSKNKS